MADTGPIEIQAYAKINLTLEVLGRRDDGYHEIASIIQTVDLHDTITLEPADELTLTCDVPELESQDNLALQAARLLREESGYDGGAHITLAKKIPVASGLGGGSSDAAAVLNGLSRLWGLGTSREDLMRLAARLGSDVSFFLRGGTAMVQGRGERVRPLPPADLQWVVLLTPPLQVPDKTASVYARLADSHFTPGHLTRKLEARIRGGSDVPPQFLFNAFDEVAPGVFPGLDRFWETFRALGAKEIHVAGTGPSLYAPVSRRELGTAIHLMLRDSHGWDSHLAETWQPAKDDEA